MKPKIVVIGSANTDLVISTLTFPEPGETVSGSAFHMFQGGKGANQAVAAARMGGEVYFVGKTGDDLLGSRIHSSLRQEGIDTSKLTSQAEKPSGVAVIVVDSKGENQIIVAAGANGSVTTMDIDNATSLIADADVVLLQLEIPVAVVLYAAQKAHKMGRKVILNPAPACDLPEEIFPALFLITPNETEAEKLTGIKILDLDSMNKAADILLQKGVSQVIITLGSRGAFFKSPETSIHVDAPRVKAIDTTAAGDVFNGVMGWGIARRKGWQEAMILACTAASIAVTRMGAQASMPVLEEVLDFEPNR